MFPLQALLPLYHQVAIPSTSRTMMLAAFNTMATVSSSAPVWSVENSTVAQPGAGEGNYVVSSMRNTYHTTELFALENEVDNIIMPALTLGNVYQVRNPDTVWVGFFSPSKKCWLGKIMHTAACLRAALITFTQVGLHCSISGIEGFKKNRTMLSPPTESACGISVETFTD